MRPDLVRAALAAALLVSVVPGQAQTARPTLDYATAATIRDGESDIHPFMPQTG